MKRVVKAPAVRREELLDRAEELFFARGYDNTPVEAIIAAARVSKGAFYHYFRSKESLLEGIAERWVERSLARTADVANDASRDAVTRLNAFLAESRRLDVSLAPLVRRTLPVIFRPENLPLRNRINSATIARVAPVLAAILDAGVRAGVLDTTDPLATAEMLLQLGTSVHEAIARALEASAGGATEAAIALLDSRLRLYEVAFNRVLGLPDHTVSLMEPGFAAAVLAPE